MAQVTLPVVKKDVAGDFVYIQYYVVQDTSKPKPMAFTLNVVLRVLGADYGSTGVQGISSGKNITLNPSVGIVFPPMNGRIDNWRGLKADGSVDNDPNWANSTGVAFLVSAIASVPIPIAGIPFGKVKVDIGHSDLHFPTQ